MKPAFQIVDGELSLDLEEAAGQARLERLEDANRAEIAACRDAKACTIRQAVTDCAAIDAQIDALISRKEAIRRAEASRVAVLDKRIRGAEAYLVAIADAPVEVLEAAE